MFVSADAIYQSWMSDSISYRFAEQGAKELTWLVVIETVKPLVPMRLSFAFFM